MIAWRLGNSISSLTLKSKSNSNSNWKKVFIHEKQRLFSPEKAKSDIENTKEQVPKSNQTCTGTCNQDPKKVAEKTCWKKKWKISSCFLLFYASPKVFYCFKRAAGWRKLNYFFTQSSWKKIAALSVKNDIVSLALDNKKNPATFHLGDDAPVGYTGEVTRGPGSESWWLHPDRYSGTRWGLCPRNSMSSLAPERTGRKLGMNGHQAGYYFGIDDLTPLVRDPRVQ